MAEDKNLLDKIKDKAKATAEALKKQYGIEDSPGTAWPQTLNSPLELNDKKGFLNPRNIPINIKDNILKYDSERKVGDYIYKDWKGHLLDPNPNRDSPSNKKRLSTNDKFSENVDFEFKNSESVKLDIPFSTRESYLLFDDNRTDYFKHGLQIIDNLNNLLPEDPTSAETLKSRFRLDTFKSTPFEQNDPVMFGFDIIIDVENSPLLNGAINDFLTNYSNIGEVASRIPIYVDFKEQFTKFFKTKSSLSDNSNLFDGADQLTSITRTRNSSYPEKRNSFQKKDGKRAYLSYYLNKIEGLDKLVEQNDPKTKKFLTDYNTDTIKLSFNEDVSLSLGTLTHLYKMLYWSKPNGKSIIPENLLRFNCDIIVSELRNYNRVIKAIDSNQIQVIKDNASRYIYSLYDCQLYFKSMPHEAMVDMGKLPDQYSGYTIEFDYKYSTLNFERFVPSIFQGVDGFGKYVGINNAAMWRVNTERTDTPTTSDNVSENVKKSLKNSRPSFIPELNNTLGQEGVDEPLILSILGNKTNNKDPKWMPNARQQFDRNMLELKNRIQNPNVTPPNFFQNLKDKAKDLAVESKSKLEDRLIQSISREAQFQVNKATALLNKTLNKVISANLQKSIRPPRNIYTEGRFNPQDFNSLSGAGARIFYDVRGELFNFLGDVGGIIGNRNRSF
jgi:hypothetical protein